MKVSKATNSRLTTALHGWFILVVLGIILLSWVAAVIFLDYKLSKFINRSNEFQMLIHHIDNGLMVEPQRGVTYS